MVGGRAERPLLIDYYGMFQYRSLNHIRAGRRCVCVWGGGGGGTGESAGVVSPSYC